MKASSQKAPRPGPLIGALLRMPWETVRHRMLIGLHERGFDDLHPAHLSVFQYPGPDGRRPSELAENLKVSKQALNHLLGQMERLGYLSREGDPSDPRARRVRLTGRGHDAVRVIRLIVEEVEGEWRRDLGAERFAQLRELLVALSGADER